ncbi:MAG: hypothetical protein ABI220_00055 [Candidatus Saccharimonadales bacterium]
MDKRRLYHVWRYLRRVHPWYFLIIAVAMAGLSLVGLRHNNQRMVELRDSVYAADKDNGDVVGALQNLRSYIYAHMNTDLASGPNAVHPPIQLKYTYERAIIAQQQTQKAQIDQIDPNLYAPAKASCDSQVSNSLTTQLTQCIQEYVGRQGVKLKPLPPIPDALYKFDFTAAKWSFDAAGLSIIVAVLAILSFVVSGLYHLWMKRYLA